MNLSLLHNSQKKNKNKIFLLIISISLFICTNANSEEIDLISWIKNNDFLMKGNISIVNHNENTYLVSVGKQYCDSMNNTACEQRASLTSERELTSFIHGVNLKSERKLEIKNTTKIKKKDNKQYAKQKHQEKYIEKISKNTRGLLKNINTKSVWHESHANKAYSIKTIKLDGRM